MYITNNFFPFFWQLQRTQKSFGAVIAENNKFSLIIRKITVCRANVKIYWNHSDRKKAKKSSELSLHILDVFNYNLF